MLDHPPFSELHFSQESSVIPPHICPEEEQFSLPGSFFPSFPFFEKGQCTFINSFFFSPCAPSLYARRRPATSTAVSDSKKRTSHGAPVIDHVIERLEHRIDQRFLFLVLLGAVVLVLGERAEHVFLLRVSIFFLLLVLDIRISISPS